MKTLLFSSVPEDVHRKKAANPIANPVFGATVFTTEVVQAVLEHSSYDRFLFLDRNSPGRFGIQDSPAFAIADSRASVLSVRELAALPDADALVMMMMGVMITELIPIRVFCNRSGWPAMGFIHSVHAGPGQAWILPTLLADITPGDTIVCSSEAGRRVVQNLVDQARERIREFTGQSIAYGVDLPVIPMATDCRAAAGVDKRSARAQYGLADGKTVLLYFGRFSTPTKCDLGPLLHAFARVPDQAVLVLAGDDTAFRMAGWIKEYAAQLGCADRVKVVPNPTQQQKKALYGAADVFVSPSDNVQETFGITLVEAFAAGLPVIASDWDGYREIVRDGHNGLLVPSYWIPWGEGLETMLEIYGAFERDRMLAGCTVVDVDALAQAMTTLVTNADLRASMADAARQDAQQRFDWPVVVRKYEELWGHMIERARSAPPRRPKLAPPYFAPRTVFAHYATRHFDDDQMVDLTEAGRKWVGVPRPLGISHDGKAAVSLDVLVRAAQRVRSAGGISIGALASADVGDGVSQADARVHIARLLKYGILKATE
jgi:glycosyltransferase involved in cell wall biosynthesis